MIADTKRFVERYSTFADRLAEWGGVLAGGALVLLCGLVSIEILARNLLNRSTMIADEISGYLNVAVIFFGLAYTIKHDELIRVGLVYRRFRGVTKAIADWYGVLASLIYSGIILYFMSQYALYSFRNDIRSAEITETPQFIPQLFIVAGTSILVIYLFKFVLRRCRDVP